MTLDVTFYKTHADGFSLCKCTCCSNKRIFFLFFYMGNQINREIEVDMCFNLYIYMCFFV